MLNIQNLKKNTKACLNISAMGGEFGVCRRKECSFAHFLEELNIVNCFNNNNCQYYKCRFIHPDETIQQYYTRTGFTVPNLPSKVQKIDTVVIDLENTPVSSYTEIISVGLKEGKSTFIFQ